MCKNKKTMVGLWLLAWIVAAGTVFHKKYTTDKMFKLKYDIFCEGIRSKVAKKFFKVKEVVESKMK